jgi:hypothetical protein
MHRTLHLIVNPPDELTRRLTANDAKDRAEVVIDLTGDDADFESVVEAIFDADAVATW